MDRKRPNNMSSEFDKFLELILYIKAQTEKNSIVLEEHARRSLASERRLEVQEQKLELFIKSLDSRLDPIEDYIKLSAFLLKLGIGAITLASTVIGIAYTIQMIHRP